MAKTRRRYNSDSAYDPAEDGYVNRDTGRTQHVIRGNSTAVELERRKLMRESGANEDRGQSVADLRTSMRGAVTPQSADMERLKSRPGARPFTPGVSNPPPVGVQPNRNAESAVAASPASFKTSRQMARENAVGTLPVARATPVGAAQPTRVANEAGAGDRAPFRGSTPEEIADFNANPATALAGTGKVAQTHYGTISSRTPKAGEIERQGPSVTTESGVAGQGAAAPLRWDQQIVANHPDIGKAGSEANKAFVAAFNAHRQGQLSDAPIDEAHMHEMAKGVMANAAKSTGAMQQAANAAQPGNFLDVRAKIPQQPQTLGQKPLQAGSVTMTQPPAQPRSNIGTGGLSIGTPQPAAVNTGQVAMTTPGEVSGNVGNISMTAPAQPASPAPRPITSVSSGPLNPGAKPYTPLAIATATQPAGATAPAPPGEPLIAGRRTKKPFEF